MDKFVAVLCNGIYYYYIIKNAHAFFPLWLCYFIIITFLPITLNYNSMTYITFKSIYYIIILNYNLLLVIFFYTKKLHADVKYYIGIRFVYQHSHNLAFLFIFCNHLCRHLITHPDNDIYNIFKTTFKNIKLHVQ